MNIFVPLQNNSTYRLGVDAFSLSKGVTI